MDTSDAVARVSGRLEKIQRLADLLSRASPDEIIFAVSFLSGSPAQGRIGVGWAGIVQSRSAPAAETPTLSLRDVDEAFGRIAGTSGAGSARQRAALLSDLMARATAAEQDFLMRLLTGELRQGALEGVLLEAVAKAAGLPASSLRRAAMLAGDLGEVAKVAFSEGESALGRLAIELFRPVQPMLAESAETVADALDRLGRASFELKLDGARVQVHKGGDRVVVFSRNLRDVTAAVPEIVEAVRALSPRELILDGEVIALDRDGTPHPFQITMRRFGRRLDVDELRRELPLTPFFFDCLYFDGTPLVDRGQDERFRCLVSFAETLAVARLVTAARDEAEAFFDAARRRGHEGVMAKALEAPYAAGRRGRAWLKIKAARTLDLVVLAAEWGHGRRRGWLSNLHLGARDPETGGFVMLGKTFKGMTDEMLEWQTRRLLELETGRDDYTVHVRPELVVEVAFNDIQASPHYAGGLALRFARVKGYRPDKGPADADTIEAVRRIHRAAAGRDVG